MPEYIVYKGCASNSDQSAGEINFGDGWRAHDFSRRFADIQPPNTDCEFRLPALDLKIATVAKERVDALLEDLGETSGSFEVAMNSCQPIPPATQMIDLMWKASNTNGSSAQLVMDGAFLQMVGHYLNASGTRREANVAAISDHRLNRALDYIETHIAEPLSVGELASVAMMSISSFARAFRAATGFAVWTYVLRRRTERAHELLSCTQMTLAEIAIGCGFSDSAHLARVIRKRYGVKTSELRHAQR